MQTVFEQYAMQPGDKALPRTGDYICIAKADSTWVIAKKVVQINTPSGDCEKQ